ncbi:MAG: S8 family serine peptidase [Acidobacteriota bacterium]|nr:S8 family serine peptidase [Acidobacteriota bacterium]
MRNRLVLCITLCLLTSPVLLGQASNDVQNLMNNKAFADAQAAKMLAHKTGKLNKLDNHLADLSREWQERKMTRAMAKGGSGVFTPTNPLIQAPDLADGLVVIDAVATGDPAELLADLEALGLTNGSTYGRFVSGRMPVDNLETMAGSVNLAFARLSVNKAFVGDVTSRGDVSMKTDQVRSLYGLDGSGLTIGSLSDSFDCDGGAASEVASNDLPAGIVVLQDFCPGGTDEGRAMMQLIHDVAPGSKQLFATTQFGIAGFANAIINLAVAGADIMVDDIIYFAEPMYQDGIIAQAADIVKNAGIPYFSAAGNDGRSAYRAPYSPSGVPGLFGGNRHDFDPGPAVDDLLTITLFPGVTNVVLQWADPSFSISGPPGAAGDLDVLLYTTGGGFLGLGSAAVNIGGDPVEIFGIFYGGSTPIDVALGVELFEGAFPQDLKILLFGSGQISENQTFSGSLYGHANAAGAFAVGASAWFNTFAWNSFTNPAFLNGFSSAGPQPIFFDLDGNPVNEIREKPEAVGPDGTNTTFFGSDLGFSFQGEPDGFPNFFGTSAAAPHVAAAAALIKQTDKSLTPDEVYSLLEDTADDMDDPFTPGFDVGFDFGSGYGFVDILDAVESAAAFGDKTFVCWAPQDNPQNTRSIAVRDKDLSKFLAKGAKYGPCDIANPVVDAGVLEDIIARLEAVIAANPGDCTDKVEDVLSGVETALEEFLKPDYEAFIGNIEGAVGDLEAAVEENNCNDPAELNDLLNALADAAVAVALQEINNASGNIRDALESLAEGDAERGAGEFKDAVAKYKDVLGKL